MNVSENLNSEVVSLGQFKEEKMQKDYLEVLSFTQLLDEATDIIGELNSSSLNSGLTLRSKTILKEFSNRLSKQSSEYSKSFTDMRSKIETKIGKLKL